MLFIPLLFSDHSGAHTTIGRAILIINQAALNSRAAGEVTINTNVHRAHVRLSSFLISGTANTSEFYAYELLLFVHERQ